MIVQNIAHESPPLPPNVNSIELTCAEHSSITGVSVYSRRAEVTRLFKFEVKTGQNQVIISGIPTALDSGSLRVEGRGAATIQDVAISDIRNKADLSALATSPTLAALNLKKQKMTRALVRTTTAIRALESYLATMHVQHVDATRIRKLVTEYDTTAGELDDRVLDLEAQLKHVDDEINTEKATGNHLDKLSTRAIISVFASKEGAVEIALVYAVNDASWTPLYDIRADTNTAEEAITLVYKAAVEQSSGEDWDNAPITLETAIPAFGVAVPSLDPWNISEHKFHPMWHPVASPFSAPSFAMQGGLFASSAGTHAFSQTTSQPTQPLQAPMGVRELQVSTKGNVNATFNVPGLTSIVGGGVVHNLTIAELRLDAKMSWVCVPKMDTRAHLNAKVKNASQYTLLSGSANIYVDGSFVSRSQVPSVSPDESFDCHLGLDPSIRVTYHPRVKTQSQSGRYGINISASHMFAQHITVHNTKSSVVARVKIIDQIPVSEDSQIQVNLLDPELPKRVAGKDISTSVVVSKGVLAMWDGADDSEQDISTLGQGGKLNWVCEIPPHGKVNLALQWEVSAPFHMRIDKL